MDKKTAKSKLRELRDSLSKVLDEKEFQSAEEIKEQSKEALGQARKASKQFKKTLIGRINELPIVDKVSQLGTAGTVAVSSAAVVQTELAVDQTQVFIAEVANDVVEQRIEAPFFIDTFVDFYELNDWGQIVIAEKIPRHRLSSLRFPNHNRLLNHLPTLRTPYLKPLLLHKISPPIIPLMSQIMTQSKNQEKRNPKKQKRVHLKKAIQNKITKESQRQPKNKKLKISKSLKKVIHQPRLVRNLTMSNRVPQLTKSL